LNRKDEDRICSDCFELICAAQNTQGKDQ
jgi:hypothetical protein